MLRAGALAPIPEELQGQKVRFEYLSPITERQNKGAKAVDTLSWLALAEFSERLPARSDLRADPFLSNLGERELREIEAGLAFYLYETHRRLGNESAAAVHRQRYYELVNPPGEDGS